MDEAIRRSVRNIAAHGDTDVFPLPFERHVFFDQQAEVRGQLAALHTDFRTALERTPPVTIDALAPVGYTGFRWVNQVDPIWNAYLLALVVSIADRIEATRLPATQVFSYRYAWSEDDSKLFGPTNWRDYRRHARDVANRFPFVIITDIADFYPRIYHHRIDNALRRLPQGGDIPGRIMALLQKLQSADSYGLPVGGPAARMLAELALNDVDHHLDRRGVEFCRYADDFTLFATSRSAAYKTLVELADKLSNEGLALQKTKTRILGQEEFLASFSRLDLPDDTETLTDEDRLLRVSVRFDPYSPTAAEDYERLKQALQHIDIVGILAREVTKAAIDQAVSRQALAAVAVLDRAEKEGAIRTVLDLENLTVLAPIFPSVMRLVRDVYGEIGPEMQAYVERFLVQLHDADFQLLSVDLNRAYFVQALSRAQGRDVERVLIDTFEKTRNPMLRREVILAMARINAVYWLRDAKGAFATATGWERRALITSSYRLGDEGRHWREHNAGSFNAFESLVRAWFAARIQANASYPE